MPFIQQHSDGGRNVPTQAVQPRLMRGLEFDEHRAKALVTQPPSNKRPVAPDSKVAESPPLKGWIVMQTNKLALSGAGPFDGTIQAAQLTKLRGLPSGSRRKKTLRLSVVCKKSLGEVARSTTRIMCWRSLPGDQRPSSAVRRRLRRPYIDLGERTRSRICALHLKVTQC